MNWCTNFYNNVARPFAFENVLLKYEIVQKLNTNIHM